jgi:hypothetical protein
MEMAVDVQLETLAAMVNLTLSPMVSKREWFLMLFSSLLMHS